MSEAESERPAVGRLRKLVWGCAGTAIVGAVVLLGMWQWNASRVAAQRRLVEEAHARKANDAFEPVMDAMSQAAAAQAEEPAYDIDKTIRVIHQVDLALQQQDSLEGYLREVAVQDYRDVAPEVLEARKELLDVLLRLYGKQVEADDQKAMWDVTAELLLSTLSVVDVSGQIDLINPETTFGVDQAKAQELLADLKKEQAEHRQLVREINSLERDLIADLSAYGDVYYRYVQEWDALSVVRDRAYLAAWNGDWDTAIESARQAIEKAPKEREAHLILAMALIERGDIEDDEQIAQLLSDYIDANPDASAPAFLLLGVQETRRGRLEQARLAFQQSAAYYPRQSDALEDMLDPYKMRSFLRKSREGTYIVELYQSTMLGAGYFSPDLQAARSLFQQGKDAEGRAKVLDHFARRRQQKQWDFILSDLQFCHDLMGPDFWEIFPEETYLDLVVKPGMFGNSLNLSVNNRSPRTLHNATLVLLLHYTDTYSGDYEAMAAQTQPAVLAHAVTSFGSLDATRTINGDEKGVADIVTHRAILVTNDAVLWVDTDEFKIAESEEFRERERAAGIREKSLERPLVKRHPGFESTVEKLVEEAPRKASMEIEAKYGKDNVLIELPRELAILRPIFKLRKGDQIYSASDNVIDGDQIQLRFKGVDNYDDTDAPPDEDLELLMGSPFGDLVLTWTPGGDLTWRVESGFGTP